MNPNNNNSSMIVNVTTGEIIAAPDVQPVVWSEFARNIVLRGTPVSAKELVGTTFDILRAKPFESTFKDDTHAWYCVIRPVEQDELFSVVLGGGAVVEILDAFAQSGMNAPLRVKLAWKDGGKFSGYYYLE